MCTLRAVDLRRSLGLDVYVRLSRSDRRALAERVASAYGGDWTVSGDTVGAPGFAALRHAPTGLDFVLLPGGEYDRGMGDADEREALTLVADPDGIRNVRHEVGLASPVARVRVAPLLCARTHLALDVATGLVPDGDIDSAEDYPLAQATADDAMRVADAVGLRLITDVEWEWMAREGGTEIWINGAARAEPNAGYSDEHGFLRLTNRWGIGHLASEAGEWTLDPERIDAGDRSPVRGGAVWMQDPLENLTWLAGYRQRRARTDRAGIRLAADAPTG